MTRRGACYVVAKKKLSESIHHLGSFGWTSSVSPKCHYSGSSHLTYSADYILDICSCRETQVPSLVTMLLRNFCLLFLYSSSSWRQIETLFRLITSGFILRRSFSCAGDLSAFSKLLWVISLKSRLSDGAIADVFHPHRVTHDR